MQINAAIKGWLDRLNDYRAQKQKKELLRCLDRCTTNGSDMEKKIEALEQCLEKVSHNPQFKIWMARSSRLEDYNESLYHHVNSNEAFECLMRAGYLFNDVPHHTPHVVNALLSKGCLQSVSRCLTLVHDPNLKCLPLANKMQDGKLKNPSTATSILADESLRVEEFLSLLTGSITNTLNPFAMECSVKYDADLLQCVVDRFSNRYDISDINKRSKAILGVINEESENAEVIDGYTFFEAVKMMVDNGYNIKGAINNTDDESQNVIDRELQTSMTSALQATCYHSLKRIVDSEHNIKESLAVVDLLFGACDHTDQMKKIENCLSFFVLQYEDCSEGERLHDFLLSVNSMIERYQLQREIKFNLQDSLALDEANTWLNAPSVDTALWPLRKKYKI